MPQVLFIVKCIKVSKVCSVFFGEGVGGENKEKKLLENQCIKRYKERTKEK